MVRWSMLVGWYELILHPSRSWKQSEFNLESLGRKRTGFGNHAASGMPGMRQDSEKSPFGRSGVLSDPSMSTKRTSWPEAGDVTQRHETTNWFDEDASEEEEEERSRMMRIDEEHEV